MEISDTPPVEGPRYALLPVQVSLDEFTLEATLLVQGETTILIVDSEIPQGTVTLMAFELDGIRHEVSVEIGKVYSQTSIASYLEVVHAPQDRIENAMWRKFIFGGQPALAAVREQMVEPRAASSFSVE